MTAEPQILTPDELRRICELVYRRSGMTYGESKRYFIERRVADCMTRSHSDSFASYMTLLRWNDGEIERLINSFTVNETYFYREEHQLRCLGSSMLPEIVGSRRPGDLVRIWSLPCATGEEPYSIALWLLENWRLVDAYNVEIVGSDIDSDALIAAAEGIYGERALSRLPDAVASSYFGPPIDGMRQIIGDIRESVKLTQANLIDADSMAAQGRFDIVFCRNVLIYFDDAARLTAAHHLYAALNPSGFLCLGHTESMARITDLFAVRRFDDAVVYQRPPVA